MEHSYSRGRANGKFQMQTKSILIQRPPPCPSCNTSLPTDEGDEMEENSSSRTVSYNAELTQQAMEECEKLVNSIKNSNSDDDDWEQNINKIGWTYYQIRFFEKMARVLDLDRMARLAYKDREYEPVFRRAVIDKSAHRMRQVLAGIGWDIRLTQWIHGIFIDFLPPIYMTIYMDILQTLKSKIPALIDNMIAGRNVDTFAPVLKKAWEPHISHKNRKLPGQAIIVILPSAPVLGPTSNRMQKWYSLFATMANVVPVQMHLSGSAMHKQSIQNVAEHMVSVSRAKIQEIRNEITNRQIILVGFNAGAALALQVASMESVCCVIAIGFAYNTLNGPRGAPDDHLLDLTTPALFAIGQNSARSSREEIESLRERMQAQTRLVVVGSADNSLRLSKSKRLIENITQAEVDNMVMDEISDFATNCILDPPGPKKPCVPPFVSIMANEPLGGLVPKMASPPNAPTNPPRKRKSSQKNDPDHSGQKSAKHAKTDKKENHYGMAIGPKKVGRPKLNRSSDLRPPKCSNKQTGLAGQPQLTMIDQRNNEELATIKTILPKEIQYIKNDQTVPHYEVFGTTSSGSLVIPGNQRGSSKVQILEPNQLVQLKQSQSGQQLYAVKSSPGIQSKDSTGHKIYTVKTTPVGTQLISQKPKSGHSPPASILMKPSSGIIVGSNNKQPQYITTISNKNDLINSDIFNMPIVFADHEGNFQNTPNQTAQSQSITKVSGVPASGSGQPQQIVLTGIPGQQSAHAGRFVLNAIPSSSTTTTTGQKQVVVINRKSFPNIIKKGQQRFIVSSAGTKQPGLVSLQPRVTTVGQTTSAVTSTPQKVEILSNTVLKTGTVTTTTSSIPKFQPILISMDDKSSLKNVIKLSGDSTVKPGNTIYIKPGNFKQIPVLKSNMLGNNLTVRKVVNIVQQKPGQASSSGTIQVKPILTPETTEKKEEPTPSEPLNVENTKE